MRRVWGSRGSQLGWGALLCESLTACAGKPPISKFPTADEALGRMHATYDCALGISGGAKVDRESSKGRIKGDVQFVAVVPENVWFNAEKFGQRVFTLTSDGKDFRLFDLKKKEFLYGPSKPCNLARLTDAPIPGSALVNLLRGEAPVLVHDEKHASIEGDSHGHYKLVLPSKHGAEEEIHLEVLAHDLHKPWNEQRVRVTYVRVSERDIELYTAELNDHRPASASHPMSDSDGIETTIEPIGPACDAEVPHKIHLYVPHTKDDVLFSYNDEDLVWNPPIRPGTFQQNTPGAASVIPVDCK